MEYNVNIEVVNLTRSRLSKWVEPLGLKMWNTKTVHTHPYETTYSFCRLQIFIRCTDIRRTHS